MTVAPMIPTASRMLSVPANPGVGENRGGHAGPPDYPPRQQDALGACKPGSKQVLGRPPAIGVRLEDLEGEGEHDHANHPYDHGLEPAEALLLESENREPARP